MEAASLAMSTALDAQFGHVELNWLDILEIVTATGLKKRVTVDELQAILTKADAGYAQRVVTRISPGLLLLCS